MVVALLKDGLQAGFPLATLVLVLSWISFFASSAKSSRTSSNILASIWRVVPAICLFIAFSKSSTEKSLSFYLLQGWERFSSVITHFNRFNGMCYHITIDMRGLDKHASCEVFRSPLPLSLSRCLWPLLEIDPLANGLPTCMFYWLLWLILGRAILQSRK